MVPTAKRFRPDHWGGPGAPYSPDTNNNEPLHQDQAHAATQNHDGGEANEGEAQNGAGGGAPRLVRRASASGLKYQLRPRALRSRYLYDPDWAESEGGPGKSRTAPLSRYRRKTANARERGRMRQINTAFQSLRGVLPAWVCSRRPSTDLTKITTLRLASAYIQSLQDLLEGRAAQDTCSWVLSGVFNEGQAPPPTPSRAPAPSQDHDLVALLYGTADPELLHHNLETFLSPAPSDQESVTLASWSTPPPTLTT